MDRVIEKKMSKLYSLVIAELILNKSLQPKLWYIIEKNKILSTQMVKLQ